MVCSRGLKVDVGVAWAGGCGILGRMDEELAQPSAGRGREVPSASPCSRRDQKTDVAREGQRSGSAPHVVSRRSGMRCSGPA